MTETLTEEETPLGEAEVVVPETIIDEPEEELLLEEEVPLGPALPQTGELPVEVFYGVGSILTAAGVYLKRKK